MRFRCQRCGIRAKLSQMRETFAGLVCRDVASCMQRAIKPRGTR